MRLLKSVTIIVLLFSLAACGHNTVNDGNKYELEYEIAAPGEKILTASEKELLMEARLAERLKATIELFDEVDDAMVDITRTGENENERVVDISVAAKPGLVLTYEQKTGIINLVNDCFSDDLAVTVNLNAE